MMKLCRKCKQPMISNGSVCRRLSCTPEGVKKLGKYLDGDDRGKNGRREQQSGDMASRINDKAPYSKCFYFWACPPSSWEAISVAMQLVNELNRKVYRAPTQTREWLGGLSNAGRGAKVKYNFRTSSVREYIMAADEKFLQETLAEQSREKSAREAGLVQ